MKDNLIQQKGIGGILIIVGVIFVVVVVVMAFFLFNSSKKEDTAKSEATQNQTENNTGVSDDDVPLKICETGDPEQCNDPISNSDVDNITNIEDEYP